MKKQLALVAVCAVLALSVLIAGCTSPTASPTPSASRSSSAVTSTARVLTPSATDTAVSPTPSATPTASATPSSSSSKGSTPGLSLMFFYRPTCPKCQATEPMIKQITANYSGKVAVTWINDDDPVNADLISQHNVNIVPTVILLNNGVEVQRWVYPIDDAAVTGQIDSSLSAG